MHPIGFLDDNVYLHGKLIHGCQVLGKVSSLSEHVSKDDVKL